MVVPRGTASPLLLKWFVSRDVPTGAPFSNGTLIPILIPSSLFWSIYIPGNSDAPWTEQKVESCLAKRERAQRRKRQRLRPNPNRNEQEQNDKMRCSGHPHLERRVEGFGLVAFPVPPSSGGACVGGVPPEPEIGLEALALTTSQQLMAVGHDYHQKATIQMNIAHFGVCICMLGVLLSCDPAAYVRPVAHASYLFRAGGVNSNLIRVFNPAAEMLS
ncbi:Cytochrome c biogenesis CcmF C-terminal-like mitochondrial protein [Arachis hypogaea]|nr:Cytochrome c biogenesis CcmF C-terminal-like mitochondrial protein [Arachis hypogaea]